MRNLFSSPLGANIAPIGIKKDVAVGVIPALLGAASIAGGIANTISQADANKTNKQISDDQLAFAKEQYEREKEENRYLIHSQREYDRQVAQYNSPVEERKRLEAAGINPALAKYGQSGLMQASQTGVGSPAQLKMPESYKATPLDFSVVARAASDVNNAFLQTQNQEAQIAALKQRVDNESADTISRIQQRDVQNENTRAATRNIQLDMAWNRDSYSQRLFNLDKQNALLDAQTSKANAEASYQQMVNDFKPTEQKYLIQAWQDAHKEIRSKIHLNSVTADAQTTASAYNVALKELSQAQKKGVELDNNTKSAMAEAIVDAAYSDADTKYWNSEDARVDAGSTNLGISKGGVNVRTGSSRANDPEFRRVRRDSKGQMYIYDNKTNRRIYIDNPK